MIQQNYFLEEYDFEPILEKKLFYRFKTVTKYIGKKRIVDIGCTRNVEITYLGKINDLFYFDIFTSKVTFSSAQSIRNEQLMKVDSYAFDDLMLGVNDKGTIVKVKNLKEMQKRWTETKVELRKDHEGFEFEDFLSAITAVLDDEDKTVYFLNSKGMFGLYFHGLFGKNDVEKMPIKRKITLLDFDNTEITEEIWIDKRGPQIIIGAEKGNDANKKITSNTIEIQNYQGIVSYNASNQLIEANLKIETENRNLNYNILWVG